MIILTIDQFHSLEAEYKGSILITQLTSSVFKEFMDQTTRATMLYSDVTLRPNNGRLILNQLSATKTTENS